jgi:glutathione S-transferase
VARTIAGKIETTYLRPELATHYGFLERELASRRFCAGDEFTAADIQLSFPIEATVARGSADDRYPAIRAYLARIRDRDAHRRTVERWGDLTIVS